MAGVPVVRRVGVAWVVAEAVPDHSVATSSFNAHTGKWYAVSIVRSVWLYDVLAPL